MRFFILILIFTNTGFSLFANDTIQRPKSYGFVIGYNRASSNFFEAGISKEFSKNGNQFLIATPSHAQGFFFSGHRYLSLNTTYNLSNKILGYNIGYNSGGLFAYGLNANYYKLNTNFRVGLRPEIGFIINRFQLLYGYNIKIAGKENVILSRHSIRFSCYFPIFGHMNTKTFIETKERKQKKKRK